MPTALKRWLGLTRETAYVNDEFDFENMRTSLYMSCVIIVLELWMIFSAIEGILTGERVRTSTWIVSHIALYLLLIAVAAATLVHSVICLKKRKNRHVQSLILFGVFSLTCILFGTYISYHDYTQGEQLFVFVSLAVFGLCLIVWKPIVSLVLSAGAFSFMYYLMVQVDGASYATQINFFVMWLCIFMCSLGNYSVRISHAKRAQRLSDAYEKLRISTLTDELTGLKNRKCMNSEINALLGRRTFAAMVDADNFKYINDTYSHATGDEVLRQIAVSMEEIFSPLRTSQDDKWLEYYRYGGDGFVVIASGYEDDELTDAIRRLQKEMHARIFTGTDIHVSLSCGVCQGVPETDEDLSDMIRYADHTLYEAKRMGRMQFLVDTLSAMQKKEKEDRIGKRMLSAHETDPLTGLPNMHYFRSHADQALSDAIATGDTVEFLYFDINNFKEFNETYGFQNGDRLLKTLAENLEELFPGALVARLSDDHFIALATNPDGQNSGRAERLREILHSEERDVRLELRVGIYRPGPGEADASLACDRSRIACNSIRNQYDKLYYVYDKDMETDLHRRQYIIANVDKAVAEKYIRVYYQPIVRLEDGKLCNLEALARWDDPVYGMLSPAVFIDVLEENHLIHKLDLCMVDQVCSNLKLAKEIGLKRVPVSVNISRRDFDSCDMVEEILAITKKYDVPVNLLDIEITESALTDHPDVLSDAMHRFKKAGFRLWLDDFGSGYSSLNSLKDFSFDVLKIDMKFLAGFEENERTKPILQSVVHLSDQIHMMALTEGVETDTQRDFLKSIGCERAQGYLFGKPMNRDDLTEYIQSGKLIVIDQE